MEEQHRKKWQRQWKTEQFADLQGNETTYTSKKRIVEMTEYGKLKALQFVCTLYGNFSHAFGFRLHTDLFALAKVMKQVVSAFTACNGLYNYQRENCPRILREREF